MNPATGTRSMCSCANGCDRHPMADPGVFPPCRCWCHDTTYVISPRGVEHRRSGQATRTLCGRRVESAWLRKTSPAKGLVATCETCERRDQ